MSSGLKNPASDERVSITELGQYRPYADLATDVRNGLLAKQKKLPPKYFYDDYGSRLFDQICTTPEYYPTRIEESLLKQKSDSIIAAIQPSSILELGSGTSRKTTHLLNACDEQAVYSKYQPFDVCSEIMIDAGQKLADRYEWLEIEALVGDYCRDLIHLPKTDGPRLIVFLGGTIGNFEQHEAVIFLRSVRNIMNDGDHLLIGADRVKDSHVLNAAYNDAQGYTAAFNLNILDVINRELDAGFNLENFEHDAAFNKEHARIEMRLRSKIDQQVRIEELDLDVFFESDESILTEVSHKFTPSALSLLLEQAGFNIDRHFEYNDSYYSLVLASPVR